jgi:hypothetical protein
MNRLLAIVPTYNERELIAGTTGEIRPRTSDRSQPQ